MKKAKVSYATRLSAMANQRPGSNPVIKIVTDLPAGGNNSFYILPVDLDDCPVKLAFDRPPTDKPGDPDEISFGDDIEFDVQKGFNKVAIWKGRRFRQKGYSFDEYKPLR